MASVRAAFNGPYAHKEGPEYHWALYERKVPYPRPGSVSTIYFPLLCRVNEHGKKKQTVANVEIFLTSQSRICLFEYLCTLHFWKSVEWLSKKFNQVLDAHFS